MKLFFDLFPVLLFFVAFKIWGVYVATAAAMATVSGQVAFMWLRHRKVDPMLWVVFATIMLLGGATLVLHDNRFIMWKPTVVNWAFAIAFLVSHFLFGGRTLLERMMATQFQLPPEIWRRLSFSWVTFFTVLGVVNLYVAFWFAPDLPAEQRMANWATFKAFGMTGLTLVFAIGQAIYLARHLQPEEEKGE